MMTNTEEIVAVQKLEMTLNNVAKVLGSVIGPDTFHMLHLRVRVGNYQASMSIEGGAQIRMPVFFHGTPLVGNEPIAIGLLAHELSHIMQPLKKVDALIDAGVVSGWFSNLVLDVAGESFIQNLLPGFSYSLRAARRLTSNAMMSQYLVGQQSKVLELRMKAALLAARFSRPHLVYNNRYSVMGEYRINNLIVDVAKAMTLTPGELPDFLCFLSDKYPELQRQEPPESSESDEESDEEEQGEGDGQNTQQSKKGEEGDGGNEQEQPEDVEGNEDDGENEEEGEEEEETDQGDEEDQEVFSGKVEPAGEPVEPEPVQTVETNGMEVSSTVPSEIQAILAEIVNRIVYNSSPSEADPIVKVRVEKRRVSPEVSRLSRTIQVRFGQPQGKNTIVAPGRIHRRELALGGVTPYRMDVPGNRVEGPNVVLCQDESGSMDDTVKGGAGGTKREIARMAAQAVALAIVQAGGQVHGLVFATNAAMDTAAGIDILWNDEEIPGIAQMFTEFMWLTEVWETYPESLIIIITDGEGDIPQCITPYNRKRTVAIVIPSGDPEKMEPVCEQVVELSDIGKLASVISTAIPRTMRQ
jgi:hypothetical protein